MASIHTTGYSFRVKNHLTGDNAPYEPSFVYRSTDSSGHHLYGFSYDGALSSSSNDDIKYTGSAWVDADTSFLAFPWTITENSGVYSLQARDVPAPHFIYLRATFGTNVVDRGVACPDPTASTGNTGTEGGTTPAGTITESGGTMIFKVLSSSPSAAGTITYELYKDDVLTTVDFSSHTIGTTTIRTSNVLQSNWLLKMVSSTALFETQTLATFNSGTTRKRRVHCNFW